MVTKFTETREPWNGVQQNTVYNYEYDAQGNMTKYSYKGTSNPTTYNYELTYKNGNVEKHHQASYTADYTYGYGTNANVMGKFMRKP